MENKSLSDFELNILIEKRISDLSGIDRSGVEKTTIHAADKQQVTVVSDNLIQIALRNAALSGCVEPDDLFASEISQEIRQTVLSQILPFFQIVTTKKNTLWLLDLKTRTEITNALIIQGELDVHLNEIQATTDNAGQVYRRLLKTEFGTNVNLLTSAYSNILPVIQALEWLQYVQIVKPDIEVLRAFWQSIQLLPDQEILLREGFIGRNDELTELNSFIEEKITKSRLKWPALIVAGVGGSGKSTLLAQLCKQNREQPKSIISIIDFDKPGMNPADSYWLESEIARQVTRQFPQIYSSVQATKRELDNELLNEETPWINSQTGESQKRHFRNLITKMRDELLNSVQTEIPLILVLDTFEEVTRQYMSQTIFNWLDEIQEYCYPLAIKVIFSGRFGPEPRKELDISSSVPLVIIDEFKKPMTLRFLSSLRVALPVAEKIASSTLLPKRPLELKLLANLIASDPNVTIEDLESEVRRAGSGSSLFAGIIYQRVFLRIKDETVRIVACPGLILRYLTAELIREVIGPVLKMGPLTELEANRILNALSAYAWLAHRSYKNKDQIWHTRELRRSMLRLMIAQEPDTAEQLHRAAIYFFAARSDEESRIEALYHRLMIAGTDNSFNDFNERELRSAWPDLQGDIDDLPESSKVLFKMIARRSIRMEELALLPPRYQERGRRLIGGQLASRGLYTDALSLLKASGKELSDYSSRNDTYLRRAEFAPWEMDVLINTVNWAVLEGEQIYSVKSYSSVKHLVLVLYLNEVLLPETSRYNKDIQVYLVQRLDKQIKPLWHNPFFKSDYIHHLAAAHISALYRRNIETDFDMLISAIAGYLEGNKNPIDAEVSKTLLKMNILSSGVENRFPPTSFSFLSLDSNWLSRFSDKQATNRDFVVYSGLESLMREIGEERNIRSVLKKITEYERRSIFNSNDSFEIMNRTNIHELTDFLSGSFPECRTPCKQLIIDLVDGHDFWDRLYDILAELIPLPIFNQSAKWEFIERCRERPETELNAYIELTDRCWNLPQLADWLCQYFSHDHRTELFRDMLFKQRDMTRTLLENALQAKLSN